MDPQATTAATQQMGLVGALQHGGFATYLIAICFAVMVAFAIERFIRLFVKMNVNGTSFMFEIQKYVLANDLDGAIRVCNGAGDAALPKVIKAGLMRASRNEEQIQNALDAASLEIIPQLERNLPYLALIANIATLLGLLGTISGLIKSFAAVAMADPAQRQAILSAGISEAMYATALGLMVAILTMVLHSFLAARASRIIAEIDEHSVKLLDLLSARRVQHSSERA
jgi:biopolymer transport protein ExbB